MGDRPHAAHDFVWDGVGDAGVIVGGDAVAEDDDFIAYDDSGNVCHIDYREVHRDATDDCRALSVQHHPTAGV